MADSLRRIVGEPSFDEPDERSCADDPIGDSMVQSLAELRGIDPASVPRGREHRKWYFANGRGASVVRSVISYGGLESLWELCRLRRASDGTWSLDGDPVGHLNPKQVTSELRNIATLPAVKP